MSLYYRNPDGSHGFRTIVPKNPKKKEEPREYKSDNLNSYIPREKKGDLCYPKKTSVEGVTCLFDDLESNLIEFIEEADVVVGSVAWLTNSRILQALSETPTSIVVQKEDFLRPDYTTRNRNWARELRKKYDNVAPFEWDHINLIDGDEQISDLQQEKGLEGAIRCVGNHNSERHPAFPRVHHKFLVALKRDLKRHESDCEDEEMSSWFPKWKAVRVWTGSFNFTENGTNSRENAIIIEKEEIALQYVYEWHHVLALSEPLDWESKWCTPEWRIGS